MYLLIFIDIVRNIIFVGGLYYSRVTVVKISWCYACHSEATPMTDNRIKGRTEVVRSVRHSTTGTLSPDVESGPGRYAA